ncbi:MAG: DUF4347 domain-containing protein [Deferribacterales bacterium]
MSASSQITFVLNNVSDYEALVSEIGDSSTVYIIDASSNALAQMAGILDGYQDLSAIHIMSHGDSGLIDLGLVQLTNDNISEYSDLLGQIGASLSEDGDILVYGCEVAAGESGKTLIATLAEATGADVAASDDITGSADKGGDWVLEFAQGTVETDALAASGYDSVLAVPADGEYTFAGATEQTAGTFVTADGFFLITAYDGNGQDSLVSADEYGAYINENDAASTGTSYIKISINGTGSFKLNDAVLGDFDNLNTDFTDVHVVGYANGVQVADTDHHGSVSVYEADYNLDFSAFSGVIIDEIRVYYTWLTGTPQIQFNLVNLTISDASTTAAPSYTAPTLTATGGTPTYDEAQASAVDLFSAVTADTVDDGQSFTGFTLTVTNVSDTTETLTIGGVDVALANGTTALSSGSASVSMSGSTATIIVTGLTATEAAMASLIDGMSYKNTDATATYGDRVVTITQIKDNGSSNNTAAPNISATINVTGPIDITFDFEANTNPPSDNSLSSGTATVTQTKDGEVIQIVSTGGDFQVTDQVNESYNSANLSGNFLFYDVFDSDNDSAMASTRVDVSLQSGYVFTLQSITIYDESAAAHSGQSIKIIADNGTEYTVPISYTGDHGYYNADLSGLSGFEGISSFYIYAGGLNMALAVDNIALVDITAPAADTAPTLTATGETPTFTEGGSAVDLFSSVTADTQDSGQTFTGFTITVTNVTDSAEYLTIGGTDVALTNGNSVSVSGGTASVSISGGTATVTITGLGADNTSFGTLVDGITYKNTSENISAANRVVTLTQIIDDGSSNNSSSLSLASTVSVARDDLLTSGDIISSSQGFTKSISGVTFNFDAPANAYVELIDETSFSGLYIYDYDVTSDADPLNDSATFVKFYAEGYSFDLNGFEYYVDNRCAQIEVIVTYGDGSTATQIIDTTGQDGVFNFTSFTISTDDVTMVELISEDYILYNNMDITDIKQSPWTINFDFESNTSPVSDDTGATVASTATQTKYGETIEIVSTGGDFAVGAESVIFGTDIGTGFSGDILSFDMMDGDSDSEYASTRIDVALQSGKYFTLSSLSIFDNYNVDHSGQEIKIIASNGTEYTVVIDYAGDDNGGVTIDLSGISGFENITSFYVYAGGMPMQLALDNMYLTNISSSPVITYHVPTLSAVGETVNFSQGTSTGVDLFDTVVASTEDSGQTFTGFTITVTNVSDSSEYLTMGGTDVALTNGNSVSVSGGTANVFVSGSTATITVSGISLANSVFSNLIDEMSYKNTDASVTTGDRVITITQITDDGATNSSATVSGVSATVSVVIQLITSATYDASTGTLVVTGTGMNTGDPIDTSVLTITGEDGNTYTLAGSYTVTASSATSFTVVLDATDKLNVNGILNNNGTASADSTTFNLAAGADWVSGADADSTGNGITVSNITAPAITSTAYDASTGVLTVTATNLVHLSGSANDIDATAFTFTGEGGGTYTLADTSDVEITSATSFTITLSSTDKDSVANLITANGSSSDDSTTYNISAADDWNGTVTGGDISDTTNSVTVTGFTTNDAAVLDLNGADTGTDSSVSLADAGSGLVPDAAISDTENDSGDWDGGSITMQRVDSNGAADGNANDVYTFVSGGNFTVTGTIEQGSDSTGTISSGGTQFATWSYTSADGKLVVSFDSDASTADVNDVLAHIGYENDTPYGDAVIEVAVNDGTATTTAEVTVTSTVIHVTQTDYDTDGDTADGMSLYEALAIAKDGDTILIHDGVYRGQFNITKNVTIDALNGENGNVVIESPDSADLQQVLPDQLTNNGKWRMPVINVDTDTTNGTVVIKNITVDGRDQAVVDEYNGNKDFIGIAIVDSNVQIDNVTVMNIRSDESEDQWGFSENYGILVEAGASLGETVNVSITNSEIYNYQKTGIIAWGPSLNITIDGNEITGMGVAGECGQNGIQIGSGGLRTGTTATITDNTIENLAFDHATYASSGILLVYADDSTITGNTLNGAAGGNFNGIDIMYIYDNGTVVNISDNTVSSAEIGILNESDDAFTLNVGSNDLSGATVAFYDGYDISDPLTETPVENPTTLNVTSVSAPASGALSYYLFGGDDSFTDNGIVDSIVYGGAGNDTISTGSGDDILVGGLGDDTLTGGSGADVYMYQPQELNSGGDLVMYNVDDYGTDTITDLEGNDVVRVSGADFTDDTVEAGDGLNVAANTIEVVADGTDTLLYIDTDGIAGADLTIKLNGEFEASDFVLSGTDITVDLNILPTVTATAVNGAVAYGSTTSSADLFSSVTADAGETDQTFTGLKLTVTNVADTTEYITVGGVDIALTNGTTATVSGGTASVSVVNGTAVVTLTGLSLTGTQLGSLIDGASYKNSDTTPTSGDRTVTLTEVSDSSTGNSTASLNVSTTVTVGDTPAVTSASYNAETGVLTVTGTGLVAGDIIDASKLSVTGEGGNSYTLAGTYTVAATAAGFSLTLTQTDQINVEGLLNVNGTSAAGGDVFDIAAADGWNGTRAAAADLTGNAVTVESLTAPAISSVSYNAETGVITVTGSNFVKQSGSANDIDVSKFTFTGEGGNVTLSATSDVEVSSATSFTITLNSADKALVNAVLDNSGTQSSGGTTYNLSVADDWNGSVTGGNTADTTNAVTVTDVKTVETVDGVDVTTETVSQTQTYTDLEGNTVTRVVTTETLTVDPVEDTRVNDTGAAGTAEIPLFWGESSRTEWATTASLPVGVGITTIGTRSPVDSRTLNDAIGDLIFYIESTASDADAGRTAMLDGGADFLSSLSDSTSTLVVNKIVLSVSGSDVPDSAIVINGTSNTVSTSDGDATPKEAVVIDASALPAGTELDLQNIEFAVIIGSGITVRGGDGANIVYAGDGIQDILLGADDDELHAGAGDDIVGSLAGDDIIYGESGNDRMSGGDGDDLLHGGSGTDTVVYSGSMSDYIITRDNGLTYVSLVSDPSEVDTILNAETIEFADGTYEIQNSDELTFIASLYEQVLDRQPEVNGFQYWADVVVDKDLSVGDMTIWFMKSAEYHDATGVDFAALSVDDQVEQLYVALLDRPSDADGKAYWIDCVESGHSIAEVAESFVTSVEMQGIYNLPNEWDFTV